MAESSDPPKRRPSPAKAVRTRKLSAPKYGLRSGFVFVVVYCIHQACLVQVAVDVRVGVRTQYVNMCCDFSFATR